MLLSAVLALSLFNPLSALHVRNLPFAHRHAHVGAWSIAIDKDRFSARIACSLRAPRAVLLHDTVIFRVARSGDTRGAVFRLDGGSPRSVAESFDAVEARGYFPQRGWILDPDGGEVALPSKDLAGVRKVTFRVSRKAQPVTVRVAGLDQALAAARADGCPSPAS